MFLSRFVRRNQCLFIASNVKTRDWSCKKQYPPLSVWFEMRLLPFSPWTLIQLKIDKFSSSYTLLWTNDAGWYSIPNILIASLVATLYFMMFYVQRTSEHSFRSQSCSLVMWGEKYLACPLLEVGLSLGDLRKRAGNKVLIRTSCHFCPQLFSWSPQSCRSTSIMGLFRVGRLCCALISLSVWFFLPFNRCGVLVTKTTLTQDRPTMVM